MNNVVLIGRLTKEPELKYVGENQIPVVDFTVAIDRGNKDGESKADFIPVQVWDKAAENCVKYLGKGSLVGVNGQIRIEKYKNKDDETRYITKVKANHIQFLGTKKTKEDSSKYYDSSKLFEEAGLRTDENNMELPF